NETLQSLLTGLVSSAITAVITYFVTLSKARVELSVEYDRELRKNRLATYQELWRIMKPLARYSPEQPLTPQLVKQTAAAMRDWYFDNGGIFLSRASRGPYFALKRKMQAIIDNPGLEGAADAPLPKALAHALLKRGHLLRAALSDDIGTREGRFV
ncbi:MAG: hypothetical protein ONB49_21450, partial [candidate division KSB1 bacterium]|nr:hypothetical protein [candidate division KSB1 bacterium]